MLKIFTDGSCSGNGTKVAYAGMGVHFPDGELEDLSVEFTLKKPTNQRAELGAICLALKYVKQNYSEDELEDLKIRIYTDSKYSIDCMTKYIFNWKKNNWKTSKGEDVLNQDIIKSIDRNMEDLTVKFQHVAGHAEGDSYDAVHNREADVLATEATKKLKEKLIKTKSKK